MKVVYVVGARPNFVKMAPVHAALSLRLPDADHVLVHTGQHYDREMSQIFFDDLGLPKPGHVLEVGSGSQAAQTARVLERFEVVVIQERPDVVIVPGDVNSTLAASLVAAKERIGLVHLEAGLRSYDRTMPEEINRVVADSLSDLLLTHSESAGANLAAEGVTPDRIRFVGNTMIDTLVRFEPRVRAIGACRAYGLEPGSFVLVTLHRPALTDGALLEQVVERLEELAQSLPVVFPIHPRTKKMLGRRALSEALHVVPPVGYLEFLSLERDARAVLTDSGGVQEETTYLGVPCFTLRENTERPVTIEHGTNVLLGLQPDRILEIRSLLEERAVFQMTPPPLWDGRAAERAADAIVERFA